MNTKPLFKALGLVFALLLVFTFSACSDDDTGGGGDTTAPTWTAAPALSGSPGQTTASIGFTLNEAGTVYYVVRNNGAEPPSSSQVTNDNNFVLASAGVGGIINLSSLTADTAYDVFIVARDTAGNLQTAPQKVDLTTASSGGGDVVIDIAAIPGVTVPVTGATPVTTITETAQYTGTVTWSGSPVTFAASTAYTATITLTAKAGFTLTGVAENFFTVAGADTDTNPANSGVVTAVFPATGAAPSGPIWVSNPAASGINPNDVTVNYALDKNCTVYYVVLANGSPAPNALTIKGGYNRTYNTAPASDSVWLQSLFNSTDYDVYFIANDGTDDSEIRLVEFRTADPPPNVIDLPAIPGVTAPVTGATPVTTITETAEYTGTVTWSPNPGGTFAASTVYTATITLTAKAGWTLTGVVENFFTVAGATPSNPANSGVVTAVFPATGGGSTAWAVYGGDFEGADGTAVPKRAVTHVTGISQTYSTNYAYEGNSSLRLSGTITGNGIGLCTLSNMNPRGSNTKLSFWVRGTISNAAMSVIFSQAGTVAVATPAVLPSMTDFSGSPYSLSTTGSFTYTWAPGVNLGSWTKVTIDITGFDTSTQPIQLRLGRTTSTTYDLYFDKFIFEP